MPGEPNKNAPAKNNRQPSRVPPELVLKAATDLRFYLGREGIWRAHRLAAAKADTPDTLYALFRGIPYHGERIMAAPIVAEQMFSALQSPDYPKRNFQSA